MHAHSVPRSRLRLPPHRQRSNPVLDRPAGKRALPVEMGRGRRARLGQPDEAGARARRREADQDRRDHRARACARAHDAVLRHAPLRRAREAHLHEHRLERARQQRGDGALRDRPGRHAVRRLRAPDPSQQPLQLLQDRGDRGARPVQQARHPECRRVHHARRADRRRGLQGRRDARRQLRGDGRGPRRRAEEAEHDVAARATP